MTKRSIFDRNFFFLIKNSILDQEIFEKRKNKSLKNSKFTITKKSYRCTPSPHIIGSIKPIFRWIDCLPIAKKCAARLDIDKINFIQKKYNFEYFRTEIGLPPNPDYFNAQLSMQKKMTIDYLSTTLDVSSEKNLR